MNVVNNYRLKTIARLSMKAGSFTDCEKLAFKEAYLIEGNDNIYSYAREKKILPFVALHCIDLGLNILFWEEIFLVYEKRNLEIISILNIIFSKFLSENINIVFVYENFGALLISETSIGCFASGDVDLYADYSFKLDITRVLKTEGFLPQKGNSATETVKTEFLHKELFDTGFGINVMWKPMSRLKLPFPLLIQNSVYWDKLVTYKESSILLPGIDSLMYLCLLHISIHGFHRSPDIRLYTDTYRVGLKKPDWDKISEFARKDKTEVRTATAAILTTKLLGMPLPDDWNAKYTVKFKQINCLLNRVYDSENNCLYDEPKGLQVLLIEILSSDSNWAKALIDILFPSRKWIIEYYLQGKGSVLKGYYMHLKNLI
jgi:hypothetical protein